MKRVLGFSGGADSQATAIWLRDNYPAEDIILTNADPGGNESPITSEFIRDYSANVFPVVSIQPIIADLLGRGSKKVKELGLRPDDPLTFDTLALIKEKFPGTKSRFCTHHLKLEPMRRWCWEQGAKGLNTPRKKRDGSTWFPYGHDGRDLDGPLSSGFERYSGVRRDESLARLHVDAREFDDYFMCWLNRPLAAWSKAQVFDLIAQAGEEPNPLYKLGFSRVGCAPCINASKDEIRLWAARFPEMIDKVRAWEKRVGRTFFPPMLPGKGEWVEWENTEGERSRVFVRKRRYAFIDEVVEWAKTTHGGRQYSLPLLEADVESGVCMSKYGLCE